MQNVNLGHKFHIYGGKITLILLLIFRLGHSSIAQNSPSENLINYEERWVHFGFFLGAHSSKYVIRYSEVFTSPVMDSVHSIVPGNLGGVKIGFVINMKVARYIDFRLLPTVAFYENDLTYRFTDGTNIRELKDATFMELPMLIKYKSVRRGNLAMYMLFGVNPSLEAVAKDSKDRDVEEKLDLKNWNLAIDVGVGLDIFFPYFKFSPEIRYSYGLIDLLDNNPNVFSEGLSKLTSQNLGIFITFEGGATNLRKPGKKTKGVGQIKRRKKKRKL